MDRPGRYKTQVAAQRRIPLQEAPSKGNSGPMARTTKAINQHPANAGHDENFVPATYAAHPAIAIASNIRQQTFDKRAAVSHIQTAINGLRPRKTHIGPWQLGCTIGHGGSCTVRLVRHVKTGDHAVAKIIHKKTAEKVRARSLIDLMARVERGDHQLGGKFPLPIALEREIVIMRLLNHPNIVRIYDVWENSNEIYLIMENVDGGELFQYLSTHGALNEAEAVHIFRQLVEALAYCHRLSIFHRDLKPENILLDKKTFAVKLIDFGMAAYQPTGDKLKTPCGSPHYAAPELLQGQPYDGSKADVWSLGVVLYLMLVGDLPFNFGPEDEEHLKLPKLYKLVLAADIKIPRNLGPEAQDLLRRVFVADPKRRLNIFELWHQPLLHKYDRRYGFEGKTLDVLTNHLPTLENWKTLRVETIDSQIFRNLQTLWHDAKEETLIEKLCSDDMNEEKYFYYALKKYQEEQLDSMDYSPTRTGLVISASDYHHSRVKSKSRQGSHKRSNSQFSVFHQEHMASKHSFFESLLESDHFDPFGIEKAGPLPVDSGFSNGGAVPAIRVVKPATKTGVQRNSLRVETLKRRGSLRRSVGGRGSSSNTSGRLSSGSKRSQTTSIGSVRNQTTPTPIVVRPGDKHKRNVSFDHRRHVSSATASSGVLPLLQSPDRTSSGLPLPLIPPSSSPTTAPLLMKRNLIVPVPHTPRTRRLREFDLEARKVSNELSKVCEEAFFRTSMSEKSFVSSASEQGLNNTADSPPSSLSNQSSANKGQKTARVDKSVLDRPLPPPPDGDETPGSYTARELQSIRRRLAVRYAQDGASNQKYFNDILLQLDSLVPTGSLTTDQQPRRLGNVPRLLSDINLLQSIPEESRGQDHDDPSTAMSSLLGQSKAGALQTVHSAAAALTRKNTIRVVEPSSPVSPIPWAPLNIRKTSGQSEMTVIRRQLRLPKEASSPRPKTILKPNKPSWWRRSGGNREGSATKSPEAVSPTNEWEDLDDRISSRRARQAKRREDEDVSPKPKPNLYPGLGNESVMDRLRQAAPFAFGDESTLLSNTDAWGKPIQIADLSPLRAKKSFFRGLFQKRQPLPKTVYNVDQNSSMNTLDKLSEEYESGVMTTRLSNGKKTSQPSGEWNLLHRLLRIKPESRVLVMCHSRRIARNILSQLILAEEPRGIKELTRDLDNRNSFSGRLDKDNIWGMKPVWFAIELFSILRDGRASKLTAVRFTQTRGSAQSLRRLVELLAAHLQEDHLHDDAKETKEIASLIKTGCPDFKDC